VARRLPPLAQAALHPDGEDYRHFRGIVTLTSRGQYGAEGRPTAPIVLRVGRKSHGASVWKRPTESHDRHGQEVGVDEDGSD